MLSPLHPGGQRGMMAWIIGTITGDLHGYYKDSVLLATSKNMLMQKQAQVSQRLRHIVLLGVLVLGFASTPQKAS